MTKTMLIDASHAEETRVAVLDGNSLDDFDIETADKRQIKGNIYLAKIVRVEPSLQAAFVEYGGNRHGFLAFAEIHPDYYQIPVADRQKLLEMEAEEVRRRVEAEDAEDAAAMAGPTEGAGPDDGKIGGDVPTQALAVEAEHIVADATAVETFSANEARHDDDAVASGKDGQETEPFRPSGLASADGVSQPADTPSGYGDLDAQDGGGMADIPAPVPEQLGGEIDAAEELREQRRFRILRQYKIQEVIHRRQVVLVQVIKEERGSKGAALTTYISLAGRYSVLMPNSPNGGGVSRKITAPGDRKRLKEVMAELEIPDGMGMIVRTAGANRPKPEIKRDCEYLLRLWDDIREQTLNSIAPALIYEEASLIKRTIRDVYTRDVDQVFVEGETGYRAARDFMRMLMPSHAKKVQLWNEKQPIFAHYHVEQMIEQVFQPTVQLRSGGYLVINQTEALVAIDVNSGRSTRERNIEDTALRTNIEAAEEVARQLRLRDLAGLIVVDFIDMEMRKHNAMVERKLKDALKSDRARIQVGSISHFGLLEMSRQRLRPSLAETMMLPCPHCEGTGHVRSAASLALAVLRAIEDEGAKHIAGALTVHVAADVALFIVNNKRRELTEIEERFGLSIRFVADVMTPGQFRIEKLRSASPARAIARAPVAMAPQRDHDAEEGDTHKATDEKGGEHLTAEDRGEEHGEEPQEEETERKPRRRRRRRRGRRADAAPRDTEIAGSVEIQTDVTDRAAQEQPTVQHGAADDLGADSFPAGESPGNDDATPAASVQYTPELEQIILPSAESPPGRRRRRSTSRRPAGAEPVEAAPASLENAPETKRTTKIQHAISASKPPDEPVFRDVADIFEAAERAEAERLASRRAGSGVAANQSISAPEPESALEPLAETAPSSASRPSADGTKPASQTTPVQPIVIGPAEGERDERKTGWWRR